jgi:hypothetical protein
MRRATHCGTSNWVSANFKVPLPIRNVSRFEVSPTSNMVKSKVAPRLTECRALNWSARLMPNDTSRSSLAEAEPTRRTKQRGVTNARMRMDFVTPNVRAKWATTACRQAWAVENVRAPTDRAWWHAVGAPLERGVRHHCVQPVPERVFACMRFCVPRSAIARAVAVLRVCGACCGCCMALCALLRLAAPTIAAALCVCVVVCARAAKQQLTMCSCARSRVWDMRERIGALPVLCHQWLSAERWELWFGTR